MSAWIVYHPRRKKSVKSGVTIYHDNPSHNQDPYIWTNKFLHTYCHITQFKNLKKGDIIFWVSGDNFPDFNQLFCDLVFVIDEKVYWDKANEINETDKIIDSHEAYMDHYRWFSDHIYKRRKRFTLKADKKLSFQPQTKEQLLLDIIPILKKHGYNIKTIRLGLKGNGYGSKPLKLNDSIQNIIYDEIYRKADVKLFAGKKLIEIRKNNIDLESKMKK